MAKKAKARTTAQRRAAAKAAWALRKAAGTAATAAVNATTHAEKVDNFAAANTVILPAMEDYLPLNYELTQAREQAMHGKGKERHANNKPFDRQPIAEVGRIVGIGFNTGQAMKKAGEATQMHQRGENEKAIHELQGAIVYLASAIMLLRE